MRCGRRAGSGGWWPAPATRSGRRREAALVADRSGFEGDWFLGVHNPPLRMAVVGAVHIAQALVPMARLAGYDVAVIDPREAFASEARFPGTALSHDWPDEALAAFGLDTRTAVVTLTHDPKLDDPAIAAALRAPVFYLGCLGSPRTHAKRVERLRAAGFGEARDRAHPCAGRRRHRRAVAGGDRGRDPRRDHRAAAPARDAAPLTMRFGPVPAAEAEGAVLAHSLAVGGLRLKKGRVLSAPPTWRRSAAAGRRRGDGGAARAGRSLRGRGGRGGGRGAGAGAGGARAVACRRRSPGGSTSSPRRPGLLRVDAGAVAALNARRPGDHARDAAGLRAGAAAADGGDGQDHPLRASRRRAVSAAAACRGRRRAAGGGASGRARASLILTRTPGMKPSLLAKGAEAVAARLAALGQDDGAAGDGAARGGGGGGGDPGGGGRDGAGARRRRRPRTRRTSARRGSSPRAGGWCASGCRSIRATCSSSASIGGRPVVGLPGCARSPAVNGADWVLERLAAGMPVGDAEIAAMGVGRAAQGDRRRGRSRARAGRRRRGGRGWRRSCWRRARRGGCAGATSCWSRSAGGRCCARSRKRRGRAGPTQVLVVLPPGARGAAGGARAGSTSRVVEARDWAEGMAASIRAGLAAVRRARTRW